MVGQPYAQKHVPMQLLSQVPLAETSNVIADVKSMICIISYIAKIRIAPNSVVKALARMVFEKQGARAVDVLPFV